MYVINVNNVNDALKQGLDYLLKEGVEEDSRNGPVLVARGPVTTVYRRPWQRILISPLRDANPFFHLMESMWMLAGRNDLKFVQTFNSKFGNYSDDGVTLRAAYGKRWRSWFGYDQLLVIIEELKSTPNTRRAVLSMWDANGDLCAETVDKPCNTQIYFDVRGGRLNMTVCNRSNDIYWGAYGANYVHMSFLQEYMAMHVGVPMGEYRQISNNYHLYLQVLPYTKIQALSESIQDPYSMEGPYSAIRNNRAFINQEPNYFDNELSSMFESYDNDGKLVLMEERGFIAGVVTPAYNAFQIWKEATSKKDKRSALDYAERARWGAKDWQDACAKWLERRVS